MSKFQQRHYISLADALVLAHKEISRKDLGKLTRYSHQIRGWEICVNSISDMLVRDSEKFKLSVFLEYIAKELVDG